MDFYAVDIARSCKLKWIEVTDKHLHSERSTILITDLGVDYHYITGVDKVISPCS